MAYHLVCLFIYYNFPKGNGHTKRLGLHKGVSPKDTKIRVQTSYIQYKDYNRTPELRLGALSLSVLYINDLPKNVTSTIRSHAYDAIIYRTIYSTDDIKKLQEDLNTLYQWSKDWFMLFNISKCEHFTISNKRSPLNSQDNNVINTLELLLLMERAHH